MHYSIQSCDISAKAEVFHVAASPAGHWCWFHSSELSPAERERMCCIRDCAQETISFPPSGRALQKWLVLTCWIIRSLLRTYCETLYLMMGIYGYIDSFAVSKVFA